MGTSRISSGHFLLLSLIVAVCSALAMAPGLPGSFVFDDTPNITANEVIHLDELSAASLSRVLATPQLSGTTRVLPTLSFAIDYWRGGGAEPGVFKTTNIAIHALTTLALAWFFRSLLAAVNVPPARAHWAALALALAWAVHPLQVSAVLYTVQRIQTMGTLFLVLSLWAYLQARLAQIDGLPARSPMLAAGLFWVLALGCKEDSALLPAYTLALELTVLRFRASNATLASRLRSGYLIAVILAAGLYFFVAVPHFWNSAGYLDRNFSASERLMTQPRALAMYLWQILVPLPGHMPFYYDWFQPSRSLVRPWTTLPALLLILLLLGLAWRLRNRMPLVALGIFLFFSAHAIASNVVALELAFEHRNHLALIGAILTCGALLAAASQRLRLRPMTQSIACAALLTALTALTLTRVQSWATTEDIAKAATQAAPSSDRAWSQLCASIFSGGGGVVPQNPRLDEAVDACESGADAAPSSLGSAALLIVLKSHRGDADATDWTDFRKRLRTVPMTRDNARSFLILTYHGHHGVDMDREELIETLWTYARHGDRLPYHLATLGYFVMGQLDDADRALPFFIETIMHSAPRDPFPAVLAAELRQAGRPDLALRVDAAGRTRDRVRAAP